MRDWKDKKIDFELYKILNSENVYQEALHIGLVPIVRKNEEVSEDYMGFINNLWVYMEYDVNNDFLWARAALQIGLIYEQKNNYSKAIQYFNTCIEMKNHAFKNSLDQKAKSGIQRCLKQ